MVKLLTLCLMLKTANISDNAVFSFSYILLVKAVNHLSTAS